MNMKTNSTTHQWKGSSTKNNGERKRKDFEKKKRKGSGLSFNRSRNSTIT